MTHRVHRQIRLTGMANGAELRNGRLYGEDHLIVPVVALVGDAVVRPLNSKGAEFVPAEELQKSTHQWANRPVVPDHPHEGRASANDPTVLEAMGFGSTFNPRFDDGRLKLEAWLNLKRAAALGGDAQKVVNRARAGEMIEVSVGAWVTVLEAPGVSPSGESYEFRWADIDSDHLAMLPEGVEGACSVDMGCGAPRAAKKEKEDEMNETTKRTLRERLRNLFGGETMNLLRFRGTADGTSDSELRGKLDRELFATEPGYLGIDAVFPDDSLVVYAVAPDEEVVLYERSYSLAEDGEIALGEERQEVEFVGRYEPVAAEANPEHEKEPAAATDCGCQKSERAIRAAQDDNDTAAKAGKEKPMAKTTDLVGRLIESDRSPFNESSRKALEAMPEDQLQALEESYQEPEEAEEPEATAAEPEPKPEPQAEPEAPADTVQLSKEEAEDLRAAAAAWKRQQQEEKARLVASLKGAQDTYTEADLKGMSVEQLQKTADLLKLASPEPARDYSGRGLPVTSASAKATLPDAYGLGEKFTN